MANTLAKINRARRQREIKQDVGAFSWNLQLSLVAQQAEHALDYWPQNKETLQRRGLWASNV